MRPPVGGAARYGRNGCRVLASSVVSEID